MIQKPKVGDYVQVKADVKFGTITVRVECSGKVAKLEKERMQVATAHGTRWLNLRQLKELRIGAEVVPFRASA